MFLRSVSLLVLCGLAVSMQYEGYKVYDIEPKSSTDADFLHEISNEAGFDGLHIPRILGRSAQIMVAPDQQEDFETILSNRAMEYKIVVEDVAEQMERDGIAKQSSFLPRSGRLTFDQYLRFGAINDHLEMLATNYNQYVTVERIGVSLEGRDLKTIRISNGDGNKNKNVILVDAGIHAREWLAPACALYIIDQLVENRSANEDLLAKFDWIILPVVNPDGYEYTHTNARMWRKTRSRNILCYGTDGNRNFGFEWGVVGASASGCSDTYRGPTPFSEVETQLLRDLMHSVEGKGKFYLTIHSYGNYILYPWGYTSDLPDTVKDLDEVAAAGADAIKAATGSDWTYGTSTNVLYAAAGGSDDYAYAMAGFPISVTMELTGGGTGFDPAASQIKGFVEEAWVGIRAMVTKVDEKYS